ncbi:MAG: polysaccharide biosynthesis/export family protein [Ferruginibacter sp.]
MRLFSLFSGNEKSSHLPGLFWGLFLAIIMFSSCGISKNSYYFKTLSKDTTIGGFVTNNFESKIQKKDVLAITVSSLSSEMDQQFNGAALSRADEINPGQGSKGYLVNEQGTVLIHYLGNVLAEGLTRRQFQDKLQKELLPFMKEPIVTVQYLNHKVTVLGEIVKPQVLNMPEEQISLLDVLVASGDMRETGSKKDVMVIREGKNEKIIKHLNLENHAIFSSPYYYVQPNDIVYVLPDNEKYLKNERTSKLQTTLSIVAISFSLLVTLLNILLRL